MTARDPLECCAGAPDPELLPARPPHAATAASGPSRPGPAEPAADAPWDAGRDACATPTLAVRSGQKNGLGQLVLALVKLLHELLIAEALRRMQAGSLSVAEMEKLVTLMRQAREIERLAHDLGLTPEDLNLDLAPWANSCDAMTTSNHIEHSTSGATLADLLERILDKGIVIAGDIKVKIVDIELLTIQMLLLIRSVDKAKEIGVDWWVNHPAFSARRQEQAPDSLLKIEERLAKIESRCPHHHDARTDSTTPFASSGTSTLVATGGSHSSSGLPTAGVTSQENTAARSPRESAADP